MADPVDDVEVEITVVLGSARMPIRDFLSLGRGAVVDLETGHDEECWILAGGKPLARGAVVMVGEKVGVSITRLVEPVADQGPAPHLSL